MIVQTGEGDAFEESYSLKDAMIFLLMRCMRRIWRGMRRDKRLRNESEGSAKLNKEKICFHKVLVQYRSVF
jgi:hypothetical protein